MKVLNIGKTDRHHPNLQKNIEKPKVEIFTDSVSTNSMSNFYLPIRKVLKQSESVQASIKMIMILPDFFLTRLPHKACNFGLAKIRSSVLVFTEIVSESETQIYFYWAFFIRASTRNPKKIFAS